MAGSVKKLHLIVAVGWYFGMFLMLAGIIYAMMQWAPYFLGG